MHEVDRMAGRGVLGAGPRWVEQISLVIRNVGVRRLGAGYSRSSRKRGNSRSARRTAEHETKEIRGNRDNFIVI